MRMLDISPEGVRLSERNTNELAFVHSPGVARLLETDGAARGETELARAIPSRDRGRQSQPMEQREERPSLLLSTASKRAATVSH